MRVNRKYLGLFAALAVALIATTGAVATAHHGWSETDDNSREIRKLIDSDEPKNIILFIGDGMGETEVTSARYYGKGADGPPEHGRMKFRGDVTTYNVRPAAAPAYPPNYVPDSLPPRPPGRAAIKTHRRPPRPGPERGVTTFPAPTYEDLHGDRPTSAGLSTGNVSTAEITDATPAGPSSHISQRGCQGPTDTRSACPPETKAAGGLGSIAEQQADERLRRRTSAAAAPATRSRSWPETLETSSTTPQDRRATGTSHRGRDERRHVARSGKACSGCSHESNMTTEFKALIACDSGGRSRPD